MTKAKISQYDAVAANNTDVNGVNIAENCPPSGMNNMGREIMAALKRFQTGADGDSVTVGGSLVVSGSVTAANTATLGNVDINGGTIDGTAIGGASAAAGSFTTLNTSGAVVFNDAGADVDFRVEGDTDANLLFVDASADAVGIGTDSPGARLDVVAAASNVLKVTNDSTSGGDLYAALFSNQTTNQGGLVINTGASYFGLAALSTTPLAFITNGNERMRIDSSGNLLVGTTSLVYDGKISVSFNSSTNQGISFIDNNSLLNGDYCLFVNNSGNIAGRISRNGTTTVNYGTSSDYRLKENVAPMTGALAKVLELKPVTYTWKDDGSTGEGFIAHELAEVCPDAVVGEKDGTETRRFEVSPAVPATYDEESNELTPAVEAVYEEREVPKYQTVDTSFLVATLTAAIQELKAELDAAKERIAALENA